MIKFDERIIDLVVANNIEVDYYLGVKLKNYEIRTSKFVDEITIEITKKTLFKNIEVKFEGTQNMFEKIQELYKKQSLIQYEKQQKLEDKEAIKLLEKMIKELL